MVSSRAMSRPPPSTERYESRLKSFRAARGLSQSELAEKVGLTRQAIYMIEAGRYLPNATTALRLSRALGCKVEDLFLLEEELPSVEAELLEGSGDRVKLWKVGGRSFLVDHRLSRREWSLVDTDGRMRGPLSTPDPGA